jgi:CHAD domain-containing protein
MPHSLRVKIKNLRYKEIITDKDCDRLITALDNKDVLDKIRDEIADLADSDAYGDYQQGFNFGLMRAAQIIDKYKAESEEV